MGKVARKYGVRVSDLKKWNGLRGNNIKLGQKLKIYSSNSTASAGSKTQESSSKSVTSLNEKTYKVRQGDSLWSISQKFAGVSVDDIKKWNDISGNNLKVGTTLKISK